MKQVLFSVLLGASLFSATSAFAADCKITVIPNSSRDRQIVNPEMHFNVANGYGCAIYGKYVATYYSSRYNRNHYVVGNFANKQFVCVDGQCTMDGKIW